jgi:hypothetical protein
MCETSHQTVPAQLHKITEPGSDPSLGHSDLLWFTTAYKLFSSLIRVMNEGQGYSWQLPAKFKLYYICGANAVLLNVKAGGTYSYHCALKG